MQDLIQRTIEELKMRVKSNLEVINQNQEVIKTLLKEPGSESRKAEFEKHYGINRNLLSQNNDYINIQLTLINFLEKYKGTAVLEESKPIIDIYSISDLQEVFDLTIKGVLVFDEKHPHFNNSEFIDRLVAFYEAREEYERCKELIELKGKSVK